MPNDRKPRIKFSITARHEEVTGSCLSCAFIFQDGERFNFFVDAGMFMEEKYNFLNSTSDFDFSKSDTIFITHNHADHVGEMPIVVKKGFNGKFYTTKETKELLPISLYDAAKIEQIGPTPPLFTEEDVTESLKMVYGYRYLESIYITDNVTATFLENGHMRGSAIILLQAKKENEELNVIFTGDYNDKNYFFTPKDLPSWVKNLNNLIIVQESTYGDSYSSDCTECFDNEVISAIDEKKSILIPCIAQGRYEVVLDHLAKLEELGKLNNVQVICDGQLASAYLAKYRRAYKDFRLPKNILFVNDELTRMLVISSPKQKIVVTTSGMASNGPARVYIPEIISRSNWKVIFTCYQSEGTLGKSLMDFIQDYDKRKEKVEKKLCHADKAESELLKDSLLFDAFGNKVKVAAEVVQTSEFSSHAKSDVLLKFLKNFKNILAVCINHGETSAKESYKSKVEDLPFITNVEVLTRGKNVVIDKYNLYSSEVRELTKKEAPSSTKQIASKLKNFDDKAACIRPVPRMHCYHY